MMHRGDSNLSQLCVVDMINLAQGFLFCFVLFCFWTDITGSSSCHVRIRSCEVRPPLTWLFYNHLQKAKCVLRVMFDGGLEIFFRPN